MKMPFRISPLTRMSLSFDREMMIDKSGVLSNLKDKYLERLAVAEQKKNSIFRTLFFIDAGLAFLITGSNFKLPFLELATSDVPAIVEIATVASAITTVFFVVEFVNWAAYDAIVRQYGNTLSRPSALDPDFVNAAEAHVVLTLKLLRSKFNLHGVDFHEPASLFKGYSILVNALIAALFILFPVLHFSLTGYSLVATYLTHGVDLISLIYCLVVVIANLLAVLIWVGVYKDFKFYVDVKEEQQGTGS